MKQHLSVAEPSFKGQIDRSRRPHLQTNRLVPNKDGQHLCPIITYKAKDHDHIKVMARGTVLTK